MATESVADHLAPRRARRRLGGAPRRLPRGDGTRRVRVAAELPRRRARARRGAAARGRRMAGRRAGARLAGCPWQRVLADGVAVDAATSELPEQRRRPLAARGIEAVWIRPVADDSGSVGAAFVVWRDRPRSADRQPGTTPRRCDQRRPAGAGAPAAADAPRARRHRRPAHRARQPRQAPPAPRRRARDRGGGAVRRSRRLQGGQRHLRARRRRSRADRDGSAVGGGRPRRTTRCSAWVATSSWSCAPAWRRGPSATPRPRSPSGSWTRWGGRSRSGGGRRRAHRCERRDRGTHGRGDRRGARHPFGSRAAWRRSEQGSRGGIERSEHASRAGAPAARSGWSAPLAGPVPSRVDGNRLVWDASTGLTSVRAPGTRWTWRRRGIDGTGPALSTIAVVLLLGVLAAGGFWLVSSDDSTSLEVVVPATRAATGASSVAGTAVSSTDGIEHRRHRVGRRNEHHGRHGCDRGHGCDRRVHLRGRAGCTDDRADVCRRVEEHDDRAHDGHQLGRRDDDERRGLEHRPDGVDERRADDRTTCAVPDDTAGCSAADRRGVRHRHHHDHRLRAVGSRPRAADRTGASEQQDTGRGGRQHDRRPSGADRRRCAGHRDELDPVPRGHRTDRTGACQGARPGRRDHERAAEPLGARDRARRSARHRR